MRSLLLRIDLTSITAVYTGIRDIYSQGVGGGAVHRHGTITEEEEEEEEEDEEEGKS